MENAEENDLEDEMKSVECMRMSRMTLVLITWMVSGYG